MKASVLPLALLFFAINLLSAKAPQTLWTKHYGGSRDDRAYNICVTSEGGFMACCQSNSFTSNFKTWLVRMDSKGDTLWTRILGDTTYPESIITMEETKDGGFIVCGSRMLPDSKMHPYIFKLDANGTYEWGKIITTSKAVTSGFMAVQTQDNGYIVAVKTQGSTGFGLFKTDNLGNVTDSSLFDWEFYDDAESVSITNDGGYVIAGSTNSFSVTSEFDHVFLLKLDAKLDSLWLKVYNSKDSLDERMGKVIQTSDGGILLIGSKGQKINVQNLHDVLLIKTDKNGNEQWQKLYGSRKHEVGLYGLELAGGDFIVCGTGTSDYSGGFDAYVLRINSAGDTLWTGYYGSPGIDQIECIKPIASGGYIIGGYSYYYSDDPNRTDIYFIRLDNDATGVAEYFPSDHFDNIFPNPFSESTTINYELPTAGMVKIDIFSSLGEKITTLVDEWQEAGSHSAIFNVETHCNVSQQSGMYFYRIQIGDRIESGKMVLIN